MSQANAPERFVWYELMTSDVEAAKAFYPALTGWGTMEMSAGEQPYTMWTVDEAVFEEMGKKGLKNSEHFLNLIVALSNKHEIKLTIAVYPWREQIEHNDLDSIQVNFWKEWAKKSKVAFLNYFPCFIKPDNSGTENSSTINKHFLVGDGHWNEAGHDVIARNFLSYYRNSHSYDNACIEVN